MGGVITPTNDFINRQLGEYKSYTYRGYNSIIYNLTGRGPVVNELSTSHEACFGKIFHTYDDIYIYIIYSAFKMSWKNSFGELNVHIQLVSLDGSHCPPS